MCEVREAVCDICHSMVIECFALVDSYRTERVMCYVFHIAVSNLYNDKYVVKHKSAKLFMTYALGKFEAGLNISHFLILSTISQRIS